MQKKNGVLVSLILIGIFLSLNLVSASWFGDFWNKITGKAVTIGNCSDTDSGVDYFTQGTVTSLYSGQAVTYNDYCFAATAPVYYAQVQSGKGLKEYYCSLKGYASEINYEGCANGCENGKCKPDTQNCTPATCSSLGKECGSWSDGCSGTLNCGTCSLGNYCDSTGKCVVNTTACNNDCIDDQKRCVGNISQTCGYYDSDSCSEWGGGVVCSYGCLNGNCNSAPELPSVTCYSYGCNLTTSRPKGIFIVNNTTYFITVIIVNPGSATLEFQEEGQTAYRKELKENSEYIAGKLNIRLRKIYYPVVIGQNFTVEISKLGLVSITITANCTDSDAGINYDVAGIVNKRGYNYSDRCEPDGLLKEYYCQLSGEEGFERVSCSYDCEDGRCLAAPVGECQDLIEKIKNPTDFQDNYGHNYKLSWSYNYTWDWRGYHEEQQVTSYYAGWYSDQGSIYYYLHYAIHIFENSEVAETFIDYSNSLGNLCRTEDLGGNVIYICSYFQDKLQENYIRVFWRNANKVIEFSNSIGEEFYDSSRILEEYAIDTAQFIQDLKNNYYKFANVWLPYQLEVKIREDLVDCTSELEMTQDKEGENCTSYWRCKIEPVICPPHGYQTRTCIDSNCNQEREEQISCSPGICAGCYVPRWLGSSDNTCIPYGFRFAKQEQDEDDARLMEEETNEYSLKVISDTEAVLTFKYKDEQRYYNLIKGEWIYIDLLAWEQQVSSFRIRLDKVNFVEEGSSENYVDITAIAERSFNAYCDMDGIVKQQKTKDYNGDWAKCQNNYECFSNICSGGECIDVQGII